MKVRIVAVTIVGFAALGALHSTLRAQQARSVLDGVYTEAQAKRGQAVYEQNCVPCHGPTLAGGEMAPPLTGSPFNDDWNDLTVGDLFERIRVSMPGNAPGSLSRQEDIDV